MPPPHTAIGILAAALTRIEEHPMPARLAGATAASFAVLAPEMPLAQRVVLGNLWLFRPLALSSAAATPEGNARVRTTAAITQVEGGVKDNVLPAEARAVVNFRILPGDTIAGVEEHVRRTVADPRVTVTAFGQTASEPSAESSAASPAFQLLARTVRETLPGVLAAPTLLSASTATRHYAALV